jgi:hypothetical protein
MSSLIVLATILTPCFMYFLLMGIVAVPQLWDYFCSQQGERRVNIEGLASSFFWDGAVFSGIRKSCKVQECQAREQEYSEIRREKDRTNNLIINMIQLI